MLSQRSVSDVVYPKKVMLSQRVYNVSFTTKYQRCRNNVVFLKLFSCIRTEKRDF